MPKWQNLYNLPSRKIRALSLPREPKPKRIGVTELIDSPLIRAIKMAHWDEIVWDYSDFLQADEGTRLHSKAEDASKDTPGVETELALEQEVFVGGWTLAGRVDHFENGVVVDHKFAKVGYAQMHGKALEQQLNCYAWLLRMSGREVVGLEGDINLNNWDWKLSWFRRRFPKSSTFERSPSYPPIAFENLKCRLWSVGEQQAFIVKRLEAHTLLAGSRCTDEERWVGKFAYAVMRGERSRAESVCATERDAEHFIEENNLADAWIQERPGGSIRCKLWPNGKSFCSGVRNFCPFRDQD